MVPCVKVNSITYIYGENKTTLLFTFNLFYSGYSENIPFIIILIIVTDANSRQFSLLYMDSRCHLLGATRTWNAISREDGNYGPDEELFLVLVSSYNEKSWSACTTFCTREINTNVMASAIINKILKMFDKPKTLLQGCVVWSFLEQCHEQGLLEQCPHKCYNVI